MAVIEKKDNGLYWEHAAEQLLIQPWGKNSLRFRVTKKSGFTPNQDWALAYSKDQAGTADQIIIDEDANTCLIKNGNITASINR
jgi:alpha-D-xyloside xylohydrolase